MGDDRVRPSVYRFSNGATLVVISDPLATISSSYVFVRTGSLFESPWMGSGVSHYLEHLVAGGTTRFHDESWYQTQLALLGGASNAYTTYDHTAYYIKSSAKTTHQALQILYEWVSGAAWTAAEYQREKGVVLKEMARADQNVARQMYQSIQSHFYKDSPYRYPVIGFRDVFQSLTSDDVMAYYQRQYVPENMVIVIGGPLTGAELRAQIQGTFGRLPRGVPPLRYHAENSRILSPSTETMVLPSLTARRIVFRYPTVPFSHLNVYPLDLLAYILGHGEQSRFYRYFVTDRRLATDIRVQSITPSADFGYFEITIETDEPLDTIVQSVQRQLDILRWARFDKQEFAKAVTQKRHDYTLGTASLDDHVNNIGQAMMMGQNPLFFEHYSRHFSSVTVDSMNRVVREYLTSDRRQVYEFVSQEPSQNISVLSSLPSPTITTKNGVVFMSIPDSNDAILRVSLQFDGGVATSPSEWHGVGYLAAQLIGKKIKGASRPWYQTQFESKGAKISTVFSHNSFTVSVKMHVDDADILLPLFAQSLTAFDTDFHGFHDAVNNVRQAIQKVPESWFDESFNSLKSTVFGDMSPYGKDLKGSLDILQKITPQDVADYVESQINHAPMTVVIQSRHPQVIQAKLSALLPKNRSIISVPIDGPLLSTVHMKHAPLTASAGVVLRVDPLRHRTDRLSTWLKLKVMDAILSGMRYPSGLLHQRLRGNQLVYVVHTLPMRMGNQDMLFTYALTSPHQVESVHRIMADSFKEIRTNISLDQLTLAKAQVLFDIQSSYQNSSDKARLFREYWQRFHRMPSMDEMTMVLDTISVADIKFLVNHAFLKPHTILFNADLSNGDDKTSSLR
ncbi:MAG: M16 family metallopeptidase [Candidatus Marinamargulisbacteria bacterium]